MNAAATREITAQIAKFQHLSSAMGRVKSLRVFANGLSLHISYDRRIEMWTAQNRRDQKIRPSLRNPLFVAETYDEVVDFAVEFVEGLGPL